MAETTEYTTGSNYCAYCRKTGHVRKNCFNMKKKESQINTYHASNESGSRDRQTFKSQDVASTVTSDYQSLPKDIWICDSGACDHYCNFKEGIFDVKEICEDITVGNEDYDSNKGWKS